MRQLEEIPAVAASERRFETASSDDTPTLRRTSRFRAHDDEEEATVRHSMRHHSISTE
jgi:hypothetical protein